jgi:hypothetical protein
MICRIYDVPGATLELTTRLISGSARRGPTAPMPHIAGKTDHGFMVIEVWDSREHIDRFMESGLGEALQEAQVPEPTITEFEVHKLDWVN